MRFILPISGHCQGWDEYEDMVKKISPEFIGISIHSVEFSYAIEAGKRGKKILPKVIVVAGGIHPHNVP